jgi:hypothetical protein
MKVYTEINYEWIDGGLKEISSESFDYEGEVDLCWGISIPSITMPSYDPSQGILGGGSGTFDMGGTTEQNLGNIDLNPATSTINPLDQPNLAQFGTGQGGSMGDLFANMSTGGQMMLSNINAGLGLISQWGNELSDFLLPKSKGQSVTPPKWDAAAQGFAKNKSAAELAANKAKSQARGSLRIDRPNV